MSSTRPTRIKLHECKPGMKLAEDIYSSSGVLVIGKESILDDKVLQRIETLHIHSLRVYQESNSRQEAEREKVYKEYGEKVEIVKDIIHDLSTGKALDVSTVNEVTASLGTEFSDMNSVMTCLDQVKSIDEYTYAHSVNVSLLCMLMGKWLKLDDVRVNELLQMGLLHDIGKSQIEVGIVNKPDKLSPAEYEEMKKHTTLGYRILQKSQLSREVCMGVLMHHEREDGSGYPMAARGPQIPLYAKICAIADSYAAMTAARSYSTKQCPFTAFKVLQDENFGKMDPTLLSTFFSNMAHYYIGNHVLLDSGETGEIIHINPRNLFRPLLRIDNSIVDLSVEQNLNIIEIL